MKSIQLLQVTIWPSTHSYGRFTNPSVRKGWGNLRMKEGQVERERRRSNRKWRRYES